MLLFSASVEGTVTLTAGRTVLAVLGCGVSCLPGKGEGSVLTELSGGVVVNVSTEGLVVFMALGGRVDTFPGAGGGAVFRALRRDMAIFPAGGGEAVLESFWEGVGFLPERGAGAVLMELGLEVVVVFFDGETPVFAVEVGDECFLVCGIFGGGCGGLGFVLLGLGLEGVLGFFAAPAADILLVAVVVAVVVVVAAVVGFAVVGLGAASSASGLTTTKEVTGVTKLYLRERFVALSANNL